jgi:hypothetical protein
MALFVGSIVFFLLKSNKKHPPYNKIYSDISKLIGFLFCITILLLILWYHSSGFWRTDVVFYLTFLLYALAALFIFVKPKPGLGLLMILSSGLINRLTAFYASERYAGVDIYEHSRLIHEIAMGGSLESVFETSKYFYAPIYHIQAAQGELLFGIPTKEALALTTMMAITVLPAIAVFLITKAFWTPKTGLLAAFLYVISDEAIHWAVNLIPTSLGVAFFALLLYTLFVYYYTRDTRFYLIFCTALVLLALTHQVSLFIAAVVTVAFGTTVSLYRIQIARFSQNIGIVVVLVVFLDFVTTRFRGATGNSIFFDAMLARLVSLFLEASPENRAEVRFPSEISYSLGSAAGMSHIQLIGTSLLLFFAIVGSLYWMNVRCINESLFAGLALGASVFTMLAFTFIGPMTGVRQLLPGRWWPFIFIVLSIFAAVGVLFVVNHGLSRLDYIHADAVIYLAVISILIVPMVGSATASTDNPYFDQGFTAERYSITEQEVAIAKHSQDTIPDDILVETDQRFSQNIRGEFVSTRPIRVEYGNPNSVADETPKILMNRDYLSTRAARVSLFLNDSYWTVHGGFRVTDMSPTFKSPVYDNGEDKLLWVVRDDGENTY